MNIPTSTPHHESQICFSLGNSSLGVVLVACSPRGVCAIALGDDTESVSQAFLQKFPSGQLVSDQPQLSGYLQQIIGFIESPQQGLDLPLDMRGTPFQQQVWQALLAIPIGTTCSYNSLAQRIDAPNAIRAVASACAANSIALAIPCHRVITSNGSMSGYRWGVERKAELLRREGALNL